MIKFTLKEPLPFIQADSRGNVILTGHIEPWRGLYLLRSGEFRQTITDKQYRQIVEASISTSDEVIENVEEPQPETVGTATEIVKDSHKESKNRGTKRK